MMIVLTPGRGNASLAAPAEENKIALFLSLRKVYEQWHSANIMHISHNRQARAQIAECAALFAIPEAAAS